MSSDTAPDTINAAAGGQLQAFVERIERLETDEAAVKADKAEVYSEAKGQGFDPKLLKKLIAKRKRDKVQLQEEEAVLGLYETALAGRA